MQLSKLIYFVLLIVPPARAEKISVAVASNFSQAMKEIEGEYLRATGHSLSISFGSTGKFITQIKEGAPFDVLLSADQAGPKSLAIDHVAQTETQFTYAIGSLVLWSPNRMLIKGDASILNTGSFSHLAIGNPKLVPYGLAGKQVLQNLKLWDRLNKKLVYGENVSQTFDFVSSGNAELGFIALSHYKTLPPGQEGSLWIVPQSLYAPIRQDAILLSRAKDSSLAKAFLDFLKTPKAKEIIGKFGYTTQFKKEK